MTGVLYCWVKNDPSLPSFQRKMRSQERMVESIEQNVRKFCPFFRPLVVVRAFPRLSKAKDLQSILWPTIEKIMEEIDFRDSCRATSATQLLWKMNSRSLLLVL
ncbi:hypothetical protein AVEN_83872-1 [Araneus ventricosus]|uniref:Uncharacterized protein n=1 Tax=Araneus ventricosus TaxID=182803 RepID=A0A4Y2FYJ4_ARAVE|nr:hypothetical protein AVEN_83872-1 [Araneus ventricosus]